MCFTSGCVNLCLTVEEPFTTQPLFVHFGLIIAEHCSFCGNYWGDLDSSTLIVSSLKVQFYGRTPNYSPISNHVLKFDRVEFPGLWDHSMCTVNFIPDNVLPARHITVIVRAVL